MGYHKLKIPKHSHTSPFKILEEFTEYIDSVASGNKIMAIQELSDLYGCIENEAFKYNITIEDLKTMSDTTKRVFSDGTRTSSDFLEHLKKNHDSIISFGLGFIQVKSGDTNYNFYHKDIKKFESYGYPHNHQQDYVSEIIRGTLTEKLYTVSPGSTKASCVCGTKSFSKNLSATYYKTEEYSKGDIYLRLSPEYHSVEGSHGTITKVTKFGSKTDAFVIYDGDVGKSSLFHSAILWRMIDELYNL